MRGQTNCLGEKRSGSFYSILNPIIYYMSLGFVLRKIYGIAESTGYPNSETGLGKLIDLFRKSLKPIQLNGRSFLDS